MNQPRFTMIAPTRNVQNENALSLGNATSRAPIWRGITKLKNAAPIGMTTRKIIVVPCMVNISLYWADVRNVLLGTASWTRIRRAPTPPTRRVGDRELDPDQEGLDPPHEEEEQPGDAVQEPDPLVVDRGQPAQDAGLRHRAPEHEGLRCLLALRDEIGLGDGFHGAGHLRLSRKAINASSSAGVSLMLFRRY